MQPQSIWKIPGNYIQVVVVAFKTVNIIMRSVVSVTFTYDLLFCKLVVHLR